VMNHARRVMVLMRTSALAAGVEHLRQMVFVNVMKDSQELLKTARNPVRQIVRCVFMECAYYALTDMSCRRTTHQEFANHVTRKKSTWRGISCVALAASVNQLGPVAVRLANGTMGLTAESVQTTALYASRSMRLTGRLDLNALPVKRDTDLARTLISVKISALRVSRKRPSGASGHLVS